MVLNDVERCGKMKNVIKIILSLLFLFAPCLYFGVLGKTTEMGLILVPSVLSVILLNFEHLKKYVSVIRTKDVELKFKDMIVIMFRDGITQKHFRWKNVSRLYHQNQFNLQLNICFCWCF